MHKTVMKSLIARGCKQVNYCRYSMNTNHNLLEPSTAEGCYLSFQIASNDLYVYSTWLHIPYNAFFYATFGPALILFHHLSCFPSHPEVL